MKVLHLFSNHKWTGPAEPCLTLCRGLLELGVDVSFACGVGGDPTKNKVAAMARAWGMPPLEGMRLDKHRHPVRNWRDSHALRRLLREGAFDLVHSHLDNDHAIALRPAREAGLPLVRSSYEGTGFPAGRRHARLMRDTAWLLEPSGIAAEHDARLFPFPKGRMSILPGSVDLVRFDPRRPLPDLRSRLGIPGDAFVVGIVARMQTHRHYEDLFTAFRRLADADATARLVVIGRGTRQEEVGFAPVRQLGLEDRVVFTGYLDGEDYVGALRMLDAGVFLVPGSDGTCRAVRELLAMGIPMMVADRGMLREIVMDGVTGAVFDGSAQALAELMLDWSASPKRRRAMGDAACHHARTTFDPVQQSAMVLGIYERLLGEAAIAREERKRLNP
ncbi:MAG: hypothetical protein RLZZ303_2642 [Candidatus Hydrogenedentota bacterium]